MGNFLAELKCNSRAVACDVSDETQLARALASCADMPPIRGVFQATMVLQVSTVLPSIGPKT